MCVTTVNQSCCLKNPAGSGYRIYALGTTLQVEPSQCWMTELLMIQPTVHTSSLATAAASFIKNLSGAETMVQDVPFQCSARVWSPWATSFPIAQMSFGAMAVGGRCNSRPMIR